MYRRILTACVNPDTCAACRQACPGSPHMRCCPVSPCRRPPCATMPTPLLLFLQLHAAPAAWHCRLCGQCHRQRHVRMRRHEGLLLSGAASANSARCRCCQVGMSVRCIEDRDRAAGRVRLDVRPSQGELRELRRQPLLVTGRLAEIRCWQRLPLRRIVRSVAGHVAASRCHRAALRNLPAAASSKASSAKHCGGRPLSAAKAACSCGRFAERWGRTVSSRLAGCRLIAKL